MKQAEEAKLENEHRIIKEKQAQIEDLKVKLQETKENLRRKEEEDKAELERVEKEKAVQERIAAMEERRVQLKQSLQRLLELPQLELLFFLELLLQS